MILGELRVPFQAFPLLRFYILLCGSPTPNLGFYCHILGIWNLLGTVRDLSNVHILESKVMVRLRGMDT